MNIFFAALIQETDTFNPQLTGMDLFRQGYLYQPDEAAAHLANTNTEVGGCIEYFSAIPDAKLHPGPCAWAVAAGKLSDETFETLTANMVESLAACAPVDGVLLALHGALVTETYPDGDGELLARIRATIGPDIPLVATLDYHANLTSAMINASDALIGFRTYPHVDFKQTGLRAARALHWLVDNPTRRPKPITRKLPMLVPVEDSETGSGVSGHVMERLRQLDAHAPVFQPSFFCSQPWLDIPDAGLALLFYSQSAEETLLFEKEADTLAGYVLDHKENYFKPHPSIRDILASAHAVDKPIIIVDSGDVTTAGGSGESTEVLRAVLDTGYPGQVSVNVVCPAAVNAAVAAGENANIRLTIGMGKPGQFNAATQVDGVVVKILSTAVTLSGPSIGGVSVDAGTRVYVRAGNLHLILLEHTTFLFDPALLREIGIQPEAMDIIVQKSHKLFRAGYKDIVKTIILADTPGYTDSNLKRLPFAFVTRPLYPLDPIDSSMVRRL